MTRRTMLTIALLALTTACRTSFVYKPTAPVPDGPKAPVKVAVLPFADGTPPSTVDHGKRRWNLVREGVWDRADRFDPLPPEFWSKALADDLAASGRFGSARFVYSPSEIVDEDFVIEGTILKANDRVPDFEEKDAMRKGNVPTGEVAFSLRATRRKDGQVVWEGSKARTFSHWYFDPSDALNGALWSMFAEVGSELATLLGSPKPGQRVTPASSSPAADSVDETIRKIMQGK